MPIIIDDGKVTPTQTQFFVKLSSPEYPDAMDTMDDSFKGLCDYGAWMKDYKRVFYTAEDLSPEKHITDLKNTMYTILSTHGSLMMTNHKPRREMYLYYTDVGDHGIDFIGNEYTCFELPIDSLVEASILVTIASLLSRGNGVPVTTAAEISISYRHDSLKVKLMPRRAVEAAWVDISAILGKELTEFFEECRV